MVQLMNRLGLGKYWVAQFEYDWCLNKQKQVHFKLNCFVIKVTNEKIKLPQKTLTYCRALCRLRPKHKKPWIGWFGHQSKWCRFESLCEPKERHLCQATSVVMWMSFFRCCQLLYSDKFFLCFSLTAASEQLATGTNGGWRSGQAGALYYIC